MNPLLIKIQQYLSKATTGPTNIPDDILDEFARAAREALRRQFNDPVREKFTLRMSNVGRPLCQLKLERDGVVGETNPYTGKLTSLFGDLIEAMALCVMKAAGVNIQSINEKVSMEIGGITLQGTYDVIIDGKLYDIKSVSKYQWDTKYGPAGGFDKILGDDPFGYVAQGYAYAYCKGIPFGGWIVINKNTGEWHIVEAPEDKDGSRSKDSLRLIDKNIRAIISNEPFKREFTDEPEYFRRKPTGNRVLGSTCGWCKYKQSCWPGLKSLPALASEGQNPRTMDYTHIDDRWKK